MSMANGIEVRMPFMDYRLITYAFSLPSTAKIGQGYTKLVLREAMKGLLPEEVRLRKLKLGFNSPLQTWLPGPLKNWTLNTLQKSSPLDHLIDRKVLQKFYEEQVLTGKASWSHTVNFWQFLSALRWSNLVEDKLRS